ncbi:hypothetical protein M513_01030, partial [Trichuris suis]
LQAWYSLHVWLPAGLHIVLKFRTTVTKNYCFQSGLNNAVVLWCPLIVLLDMETPDITPMLVGGSHLAESRLADWSFGRRAVWPTGRLVDRSYGRQVVWPTGRLADRSFGRLVVWPTGRLVDWSFGRLVFWTTGRLADRSFGRHVTFLERIKAQDE